MKKYDAFWSCVVLQFLFLTRIVVEACPDRVNTKPHVIRGPWLFSLELSMHAKVQNKTGARFKNNTPSTLTSHMNHQVAKSSPSISEDRL